ncbi:unnamed protein product [Linum trigynum]|uniref:DUF4219 domain-containing protein n=1 Tax=Linum trigynum TaxID=586398 RepID=A0AAV2FYA9_9ROSI
MAGVLPASASYSANTNPPWFDGTDYTVWKKRIRIYLRGVDGGLWAIVKKGPIPMDDEEDKKWEDDQRLSSQQDSRAMHILFSALNPEERSQVA